MLFNVVDHRTKKFRWAEITAIVEPTIHDETCVESDVVPAGLREYTGVGYAEKPKCSFQEAVKWAEEFDFPVTLYVYDLGDGISTRDT